VPFPRHRGIPRHLRKFRGAACYSAARGKPWALAISQFSLTYTCTSFFCDCTPMHRVSLYSMFFTTEKFPKLHRMLLWIPHVLTVTFVHIPQIPFSHFRNILCGIINKKAQLSLTNPRDAKACQKLLQFNVLTTLSLTILAYLHSFSCCCVRNLQNRAKFTENSNLWSSRSSKVINVGVNRKPMYDFLLVTNSNFAVSATVFEILTLKAGKSLNFHTIPFFEAP